MYRYRYSLARLYWVRKMLISLHYGDQYWRIEVQPSWVFIGRSDAEAETPVLRPPHAKSWFIGKDSDAGRDWEQEEKGTTEDEIAGWHHGLDGDEFEWTLGDGDGQGGLVCCNSWGCKELDMTERLNWTELKIISSFHSSMWKEILNICEKIGKSILNLLFKKKLATFTF